MAKDPVPATKSGRVWDSTTPGAYGFERLERCIIYVCPCGCDQLRSVPIREKGHDGSGWEWNGDVDKPTLTPSIHIVGECNWHGFLTDGMWITC